MPLSPVCFFSRSNPGDAKGVHDMNISFLCQGWYPSFLRDVGLSEQLGCAGISWCVCLAQRQDISAGFSLSTKHRPFWEQKACPSSHWDKRTSGMVMGQYNFVQYSSPAPSLLLKTRDTTGPTAATCWTHKWHFRYLLAKQSKKQLFKKLWLDLKQWTEHQKLKYKLKLLTGQYKQSPNFANICICKNPGRLELKDPISKYIYEDQPLPGPCKGFGMLPGICWRTPAKVHIWPEPH